MEAPRILLLAALLVAAAPTAHSHGFMFEPRARNVITGNNYCPHCLASGGERGE